MTDQEAAQTYTERLKAIESGYLRTFTELGEILVEVEARQLWRFESRSFTQYIVDCLPVSNGTAFSAYRVAKVLAEIPPAERERIPRGNLETMAGMSEKLAKSEGIRTAAQNMAPKEFRETIERDYPGQHIEAHKPMRFSPERSARDLIDETLGMIQAVEECSRDQALEFACVTAKDFYEERYVALLREKGAVQNVGTTRRTSVIQ